MIRALILSSNGVLTEKLRTAIDRSEQARVVQVADRPYSVADLLGRIRSSLADVVFIDGESVCGELDLLSVAQAQFPAVQFVAFDPVPNPNLVLAAMRRGAADFLTPPFELDVMSSALKRIVQLIAEQKGEANLAGSIFCFLPAKPGVGASVIVSQTAMAAAKEVEGKDVLLADFDLTSSMIRFLLNLTNSYSLIDALDVIHDIDESNWKRMVSQRANLDILHAGKLNPSVNIGEEELRNFAEFVRGRYRLTFIDLSGNIEKYSRYLMHVSKKIILVTTPETAAVEMATEKYQFLASLDLGSNVALLINRCGADGSPEKIAEVIGAPLLITLPNDYAGVQSACAEAKQVAPGTALGRQIRQLAKLLLGKRAEEPDSRKPNGLRGYLSSLLAKPR